MGQRFGHLTVIGKSKNKTSNFVKCKCDCGNEVDVRINYLKIGHNKSCGDCTKYINNGEYIKCYVKNGKYFFIDINDLHKVQKYNWTVGKNGYVSSGNGRNHRLRLHRYLLDCPKGYDVDHINGKPYDNRKCNLRISTHQNNSRNTKLRCDNSTGYKGVSFAKRERKYRAYIVYKKQISLGYFDNPIDAAKAYDKAAKYYFGDFARLNFREEAS